MKQIFPDKMHAVYLNETGNLTVGEIPVPKPGKGQVLVKIAAAPINPSDLGFLQGSYGFQKSSPIVPGFEGSGTVIAAGSGLLPRSWLGKRIACAGQSGGTWAEYIVTSAAACFPLPKKISFEQGAMSFVNPLTVTAFFDIAKKNKHRAIISTAASSALGRMILRLGLKEGIPVINIVRRLEQADILFSLGAKYVLVNSDPDFLKRVQQIALELNATLILDAIAGDLTQQLLDVAPFGSEAVVYGFLSGEKTAIDARLFVKEDKSVRGFFLANWMSKKGILKSIGDMRRAMRLLDSELSTTIQKRLPLSEVHEAIEIYRNNMTAGKVLLVPDEN